MRLLGITPGDGRELAPWLEALGQAGLTSLLVRELDRDPAGVAQVVDEASRWIRTVVVHERCAGAEAIASARGHAVHRRAWSCHSTEELDAAFDDGAPYCLLSPIWRPTSKPNDTRKPLGFAAFERAAGNRNVYALGGVLPSHMAMLRQQNVYGVAVLGGLFHVPNPTAAADRLRAFL